MSDDTPSDAPSGAPDAPSPFAALGLPEPLLRALADVGYEAPSPIQAATIPHLLDGRDVLGQAQTGTGKTAAFALPVLARLDLSLREPQALVLTPTRELALQVAEAFQKYAAHLPGFHVVPIYGGQAYPVQLRPLQRGVHVVVGTPGRVMDHLSRGSLRLGSLRTIVLDEADEMLRMGFLEDVEWILQRTPDSRQTALFSATMPPEVRRIAQERMHDPAEITVEHRADTAALIRQRYWVVTGTHKLDALTRILEVEPVDGMLVFVRTKTMTAELSEKLEARGFACAPLSGDVPQNLRERTIDRFREGSLDVLVATDVAARGLDVDRVSHVVNFDVPADIESYVHRIGRTGRAGREGDAILFVAPRERGIFHAIERMIGRRIEPMAIPTPEQVNAQRVARFKERIAAVLASDEDLSTYAEIVAEFVEEHEVEPMAAAAALARLAQGDRPLLIPERGAGHDEPRRAPQATPRAAPQPSPQPSSEPSPQPVPRPAAPVAPPRPVQDEPPRRDEPSDAPQRDVPREEPPHRHAAPEASASIHGEAGMETFRVEVGLAHGARPSNIVGAIANEAGIEGRRIGRIDIREEHSVIDLPVGMPPDVFDLLQTVRVCGHELRISRVGDRPRRDDHGPRRDDRGPPQHRGRPHRGRRPRRW